MLAENWHPLERWPSAPAKLAIVLEPSLARHQIRFVLPNGEIEAKAKGDTLHVDGQSIAIKKPLGWRHGAALSNVTEAHARVNAFLDAAYTGDIKTAHTHCATWYTRKALEKHTRSIGKHGAEDLPRTIEGTLHTRYQRVAVCNGIFGPKGITAFVTIAPIDGEWQVLASAFSAFTPQPKPSGPPIPTM